MPKHILLGLTIAAMFSTPTFAQSVETDTQDEAETSIDAGVPFILEEIPIYDLGDLQDFGFKPEIDTPIKKSFELGGSYTNSVTLNDNGSTLNLDDVTTFDFGFKAERELLRSDNISLSGALSQEARYGRANDVQLNGAQVGSTNFRQLGAYADLTARLESQNESDWTPFVSAGVGVVHDRVAVDDQTFKDLSPVGRYRAGLEKKINETTTFGIGVGQSFKLD